MSAFSEKNNLVLGQLATEKKSNEITAFPMLIKMLDIRGATVTIDAAGCQKNIAELIRKKMGITFWRLKKTRETYMQK